MLVVTVLQSGAEAAEIFKHKNVPSRVQHDPVSVFRNDSNGYCTVHDNISVLCPDLKISSSLE